MSNEHWEKAIADELTAASSVTNPTATAATAESSTGGKPVKLTPLVSLGLTAFLKTFGKYAVRPILGAMKAGIGLHDLLAEMKTFEVNNPEAV